MKTETLLKKLAKLEDKDGNLFCDIPNELYQIIKKKLKEIK